MGYAGSGEEQLGLDVNVARQVSNLAQQNPTAPSAPGWAQRATQPHTAQQQQQQQQQLPDTEAANSSDAPGAAAAWTERPDQREHASPGSSGWGLGRGASQPPADIQHSSPPRANGFPDPGGVDRASAAFAGPSSAVFPANEQAHSSSVGPQLTSVPAEDPSSTSHDEGDDSHLRLQGEPPSPQASRSAPRADQQGATQSHPSPATTSAADHVLADHAQPAAVRSYAGSEAGASHSRDHSSEWYDSAFGPGAVSIPASALFEASARQQNADADADENADAGTAAVTSYQDHPGSQPVFPHAPVDSTVSQQPVPSPIDAAPDDTAQSSGASAVQNLSTEPASKFSPGSLHVGSTALAAGSSHVGSTTASEPTSWDQDGRSIDDHLEVLTSPRAVREDLDSPFAASHQQSSPAFADEPEEAALVEATAEDVPPTPRQLAAFSILDDDSHAEREAEQQHALRMAFGDDDEYDGISSQPGLAESTHQQGGASEQTVHSRPLQDAGHLPAASMGSGRTSMPDVADSERSSTPAVDTAQPATSWLASSEILPAPLTE